MSNWKPIPGTSSSYWRIHEEGMPSYRFDSEGCKTSGEFDKRITEDGWCYRETTDAETGEIFGAYYPPRVEALHG